MAEQELTDITPLESRYWSGYREGYSKGIKETEEKRAKDIQRLSNTIDSQYRSYSDLEELAYTLFQNLEDNVCDNLINVCKTLIRCNDFDMSELPPDLHDAVEVSLQQDRVEEHYDNLADEVLNGE